MNFINKIKNLYKVEWLWRTFVVTQIFGIVVIFIMDITQLNWNFLYISIRRDYWESALLESWDRYPLQNYITLFAIFLPFTLTKAVDWILSAKEKPNSQ